jgi:2-oxo-hept-3-ene-1,7-dioate hydratase
MQQSDITDAANALDGAERSGQQIGILSLRYPDMSMADAYAIQDAWIAAKLQAGRRIIGHKIGLTSKAMQLALNIDTPDSGILLDDMAFADGATIAKDRFIQPRIEAEVAFVMAADLSGPNCTIFDVLNATDYVVPALEILDTRILRSDPETGKGRNVLDTIADNAANAGIVIGGEPTRPDDIDFGRIGAVVRLNGAVEETGLAAAVLNHPANGVAWLVNRLAEYDGGGLTAGEVVLSGSFIRPLEAPHGSTFSADYGAFGSVNCYFE